MNKSQIVCFIGVVLICLISGVTIGIWVENLNGETTSIVVDVQFPEAIYAAVEIINNTYYYDAFRWDENHHIYIRLNDSWTKGSGWGNAYGFHDQYIIINRSKVATNQSWYSLRFNDSVWVDHPTSHFYIWYRDSIKFVNLRKNPGVIV